MPPLDLAAAVLMACVWGFQVVAVKIGAAQLPPLLMVGLRFVVMAVLLLPFTGLPARARLRPLALIALFTGGLHFALVYLGIARIDAATAAITYQLAPPFTVLVAWAWLGDRMRPAAILGMALAFAGVVILAGGPGEAQDLLGIGFVIAATMAFAVGTVLTKRHGPFDALALNAWIALLTAPQILLASAVVESGQLAAMAAADWRGWGAVLYTALTGGIAGFWLWYWLLGRHPISRVAPFTLLAPMFAILGGVAVLGERPGLAVWLGGALTLLGVALIQVLPALRPARE